MELAALRSVYQRPEEKCATVYLEGRAPGEDAGEQMRLRWKALRERLQSAGAGDAALQAIEAELLNRAPGEPQTDGRVLVASDAGIVLDAPWDAALGAGDAAHWTALPELGAYVREELRSVRELVVVADSEGAQLRQDVVAKLHQVRQADGEIVAGDFDEVHKPRGGALAHKQMQRRADEALHQNAQDIVDRIRGVASQFRPHLLVLAGEVQARTAIRQVLPDAMDSILVETEHGSRDSNASEEPLTEFLINTAGEDTDRREQQHAEQLHAGLAHDNAVQGADAVAHAAEMGAVDTLLFEDGADTTREAFLLKACAETSSSVALVTAGTALTDGVAALLRFPLNS